MAVFGAQTVVSLVIISYLNKICPLYSLGRWLLTEQNLYRYLHPTDEELRQLSNVSKASNKKKSGKQQPKKDEPFTVSKNMELVLSKSPIVALEVLPLRFYTDFVWLIDFSLATTAVVILTYIHEHYVSPQSNEYGLSSVWCCLLVVFSIKPLLSIILSYKISQNSGEIVLSCLFGFFFLLSAMVLLIVGDEYLEFRLVFAHEKFDLAARDFLDKRGISGISPINIVTFRIILAFLSGFIGALLTFPGLRLAKCHLDCLPLITDRPFTQLIMYVDLLLPMFMMALWVPPISRLLLVGQTFPGTSLVISNAQFDVIKDVLLVILIISRMWLLKDRLQAYLNTAHYKIVALRKEAGKITNVDLQRCIAQVFYYLCVVTLQLVAPLCLLAAIVLMEKSFTSSQQGNESTPLSPVEPIEDDLIQSVKTQVQEFTVTIAELRAVFSAHILQAVTSYLQWFVMYAWTATTYFGLFYHTYMFRT